MPRDPALEFRQGLVDGHGHVVRGHGQATAVHGGEAGMVADQAGDIGRAVGDRGDELGRAGVIGDAADRLSILDQVMDLGVGHLRHLQGEDVPADRGDVLHQLGEVGGHAGDHQLHPHRPVREVLDQLGDVAAEFGGVADIELVEDDQHPGADDLGEHVRHLARRDFAGGQQVQHRRAALGLGGGGREPGVEQQRNLRRHRPEQLIEVRA